MTDDEALARALDDAVSAYVQQDQGRVVVGWVLMAAVKTLDSDDGGISHVYEAPAGQPVYATLGILEVGRAQIREDCGVVGNGHDDG